jgi:hypothetical protein
MPNATTIRDAVLECFRAHGDAELTLRTVEDWVSRQYPGRWKGVFADVSGLVIGATDGTYRSTDQFLHRVRRGVYRLDEAYRVGRQPRVTSCSTRREQNLKHASEAVASESRAGHESPARRCIWVEGIPSVWGTKAEKPWRETLKTHIPWLARKIRRLRAFDFAFLSKPTLVLASALTWTIFASRCFEFSSVSEAISAGDAPT